MQGHTFERLRLHSVQALGVIVSGFLRCLRIDLDVSMLSSIAKVTCSMNGACG